MKYRRWTAGLILLALCLLCCGAAAGEEGGVRLSEIWSESGWIDAEAMGVSPDTRYPVYAAPFEDAWRPENGQAELITAEYFNVLGRAGEWRMVEYWVTDTAKRVGWVKIPYEMDVYRDDFPNDATLLRLVDNENLTDDPWGSGRIVTRLHKGDTVVGLCQFDAESFSAGTRWFYVQTEVDGQIAWLFIDPGAVEEVPMYQVEGNTLTVQEGVTRLGWAELEWVELPEESGDEDSGMWICAPLRKDDLTAKLPELSDFCEYNDESGAWEYRVRSVSLPDSLRVLGRLAFYSGKLEAFRFPENLEYLSDDAFNDVSIGRVIIPAGFRCAGPVWNCYDYCSIGEFCVEEGNPLYSSRDGVLFSADGTVLLRYPNGKKDLHYDVPAGVTEIAENAFGSESWNIPLQTVSLPAGLKKIGRVAFSGCGRLHSLTVPLTVTEIGEYAFRGCTSLERLSLPPGLSVRMDTAWTEYGDFTWFNGDNGTTRLHPKEYGWGEEWEEEE